MSEVCHQRECFVGAVFVVSSDTVPASHTYWLFLYAYQTPLLLSTVALQCRPLDLESLRGLSVAAVAAAHHEYDFDIQRTYARSDKDMALWSAARVRVIPAVVVLGKYREVSSHTFVPLREFLDMFPPKDRAFSEVASRSDRPEEAVNVRSRLISENR